MTDQYVDFWILIFLVAVGLVSAFLELKRPLSPLKKTLRACALITGLCSIYFLWLTSSEIKIKNETAVIVTRGFNTDSLDVLNRKYGKENIFLAEERPYRLSSLERYDSIIMLGYGLPDPELIHFDAVEMNWLDPNIKPGISNIWLPEEIFINTPFKVNGIASGLDKIIVESETDEPDTIQVRNDEFSFTLEFKTSGRHLIYLTGFDSTDRLSRNSMDLRVAASDPLSFVLLGNVPSAEMRFLKEHLAEAGHSIINRIRISRNKYSWDFINTDRNRNFWLDLNNKDLVILDEGVFRTLNANEFSALKDAVDGGLGVLVRLNGDVMPTSIRGITVPDANSNSNKTASFGKSEIDVSAFRFKSNIMNGLLSVQTQGKGKIAFGLVNSTYPLLLSGDSVAYRNFWNEVIYNASRVRDRNMFGFPPVYERNVDEHMSIDFYSEELPDVFINREPVPVEQDLLVPERWTADYWPDEAGWHRAKAIVGNDTTYSEFFVPEPEEWETARASHRLSVNRHLFRANKTPGNKEAQPLPGNNSWLWLCLLLISFGFLWMEPRL